MNYEPIAKPSDKRGLALFEEVIDEIEANNFRTWHQDYWLAVTDGAGHNGMDIHLDDLRPDVRQSRVPANDCGTVACVFGHIVFKAGARMYTRGDGTVDGSHVINPDTGLATSIRWYAEDLLDLRSDLAMYVSAGSLTWAQILDFRDAWRIDAAAGPGVYSAREALVGEDFEVARAPVGDLAAW